VSRWLLIVASAVAAGVAFAGESATIVAEPSSLQPWVELLKAGGPYTVTAALAWFALRKDGANQQQAVDHAKELKDINAQLVDLISAATVAQTSMSTAVLALKDAILALERSWDRK
jgi:cell wall assembly regulator SMI1